MRKELTKVALTLGLTVALAIGMTSSVTAQQQQDSNVTVEVSSDIAIDVRPSSLAYTSNGEEGALDPGAKRRVSDEDFEHLELENIGSEPLDEIYMQSTMQANDAFADPNQNHSTGNFVTVSTETAQGDANIDVPGLIDLQNHHYINRVEYFEDSPPTYITTEEGDYERGDSTTFSVSETNIGRLRVGEAEYFFVVYSSSNNDDVAMRVGNTPHTPTQLGTVDFSNSGGDYTSYDNMTDDEPNTDVFRASGQDLVSFNSSIYTGDQLISDGTASVSSTSVDGDSETETRSYNLYVDTSNDQVIRTKLNTDVSSPQDSGDTWDASETKTGQQSYLVDAGNTESEALQPGENFPVDIGVQVPLGVDAETVEQGTVTVKASQWQ